MIFLEFVNENNTHPLVQAKFIEDDDEEENKKKILIILYKKNNNNNYNMIIAFGISNMSNALNFLILSNAVKSTLNVNLLFRSLGLMKATHFNLFKISVEEPINI